jgi:hypothetical protein
MALNEMTREAYKKQKAVKREPNKEQKPAKIKQKVRVRLIPIPIRLLIVAVLIIISFVIGTSVGYGALGGEKAIDVFKPSTWTHITDLMKKE